MTQQKTDEIIIRNSRVEDIEELVQVGIDGFGSDDMGVTQEKFVSHLETFPEGQFCVEYKGKLIGSCSSLIIDVDDYGVEHSFNQISGNGFIKNHNPNGKNLYGIDVVVLPEYRKLGAGKGLYQARRDVCEKYNLESIMFGGRLPEYYKHADKLTPEQYVEKVLAGDIYDPVITFQVNGGFEYKGIMPAYIPKDEESLGYALLLEWKNPKYTGK